MKNLILTALIALSLSTFSTARAEVSLATSSQVVLTGKYVTSDILPFLRNEDAQWVERIINNRAVTSIEVTITVDESGKVTREIQFTWLSDGLEVEEYLLEL